MSEQNKTIVRRNWESFEKGPAAIAAIDEGLVS